MFDDLNSMSSFGFIVMNIPKTDGAPLSPSCEKQLGLSGMDGERKNTVGDNFGHEFRLQSGIIAFVILMSVLSTYFDGQLFEVFFFEMSDGFIIARNEWLDLMVEISSRIGDVILVVIVAKIIKG